MRYLLTAIAGIAIGWLLHEPTRYTRARCEYHELVDLRADETIGERRRRQIAHNAHANRRSPYDAGAWGLPRR